MTVTTIAGLPIPVVAALDACMKHTITTEVHRTSSGARVGIDPVPVVAGFPFIHSTIAANLSQTRCATAIAAIQVAIVAILEAIFLWR